MTRWPASLSQAFAEPALQRRAVSAGLTALVHAGLLAVILTLPLYEMPRRSGESGRAIDVRLYTVAGENAQTDAPLNEPSLAETAGDDGAGEGESGENADAGPPRDQESATQPEPVTPPAEDTPAPQPPAEAAAPEPETDPASNVTLLATPGSGNRALDRNERAPAPPPAPSAPADPDEPVATTQIRPETAPTDAAAPSFADILARIDPALDPDDFLVAALRGDANAVVRESLCLSSSQATLEAGECPDGPNPDQAALAAYGLTEPGEAPPQFAIDMDRLAFQLAQMGTDASVIERLMLGLSEARREAVRAPTIERMMGRDQLESGRDNLGIHNPFGKDGIPMPDDPEG